MSPINFSFNQSNQLTLKLYFQESPPVSSTAAIKNMTNDALQKCNHVSKTSAWKTKILTNISVFLWIVFNITLKANHWEHKVLHRFLYCQLQIIFVCIPVTCQVFTSISILTFMYGRKLTVLFTSRVSDVTWYTITTILRFISIPVLQVKMISHIFYKFPIFKVRYFRHFKQSRDSVFHVTILHILQKKAT